MKAAIASVAIDATLTSYKTKLHLLGNVQISFDA